MNNDADVLKFAKDVKEFGLVDIYVERRIDEPIVDVHLIVEDVIDSDYSYGLQDERIEVDCAEGDGAEADGKSVDDAGYVASDGEDEHDSFLDNANGVEAEFDEDSDELNTPQGSDDKEVIERFPHYKEGIKFQKGMMFNNKNVIRDAIKEYAMGE